MYDKLLMMFSSCTHICIHVWGGGRKREGETDRDRETLFINLCLYSFAYDYIYTLYEGIHASCCTPRQSPMTVTIIDP